MKKPPRPFILIIALHIACSALYVLDAVQSKDLTPALLGVMLSLLALHGSVVACKIMIIVCAYSAHSAFNSAVETWSASPAWSAALFATAALMAASANYLLSSKKIKEFQDSKTGSSHAL